MAAVAALVVLGLRGCDEKASAEVGSVRIAGQWFHLELALDGPTRERGLSGRTHIEEDGGMVFAFPRPAVLSFVMRDCPVPIDIIYLDGTGRVVSMHRMQPEEPRRPGESDQQYEDRLRKYSSRYSAQFAIELRGGTLDGLKVSEGDKVQIDSPTLKSRAR